MSCKTCKKVRCKLNQDMIDIILEYLQCRQILIKFYKYYTTKEITNVEDLIEAIKATEKFLTCECKAAKE